MTIPDDKGKREKKLDASGITIIGVDEVGRGCIAGPVVTAAVCLNYKQLWELSPKKLRLIRDSKTLSAKQRQEILPAIADCSLSSGIGIAHPSEIDQMGIVEATFTAMRRAISKLKIAQDNTLTLVDGKQKISQYEHRQEAIVKGDSLIYAIAAASIVAKEHRDDLMSELHTVYPAYEFNRHVGYGTKLHIDMIKEHGVCEIHRKSFAPIRQAIEQTV